MTEPAPPPKAVRQFARGTAKAVGVEPETFQAGPLLWRIRIKGEHIEASADFRVRLGGKVRYASGQLTVDGKARPILELPELRKLWDRLEGRTARAKLPPLLPPPPGAEIPAEVTQLHGRITTALARAGEPDQVVVGYDPEQGYWVLGVSTGGGDGARITFVPLGNGNWKIGGKVPIQVVTGGIDMSARIGSDVRKALAALAGRYPGADSKPPAGRGETGRGARDTGIETRKRVVIRE